LVLDRQVSHMAVTPIRDWLFGKCAERFPNSTHNEGALPQVLYLT